MARTLAQIKAEIDKLQREADTVRARETKEVITRIREAIEVYGLTAVDLGFARNSATAPRKAVRGPARKAPGKKTVGKIRYRDDAGNSWTGHGKRPNWFKDAIASGKTPEQLAV